jgi:formimidoylglutamate deiminase
MKHFFANRAFLDNQQWAHNVRIAVDSQGFIADIQTDSLPEDAEWLSGPVIPGMPNLHSHAFQRAMAGLAEYATASQSDSFWSWRDRMYGMMDTLTPDHIRSIANYLYIEMLKAGFTSVAEFHYVHHDQQGKPYADHTEMAKQIAAAAQQAGIGLTLLPTLYSWAGFGAQPATAGQRRFLHSTDSYLRLWQDITAHLQGKTTQRTGLCFHSLRAVTSEQIDTVLQAVDSLVPIHIHVAEQQKEVDDCLTWCGQRPVAYLYDHHAVNEQWCLIHATHLTDAETVQIARSGAVVGLCTTTEANLGDGFFPLPQFLREHGRFGIGSDSHISVNVPEEIRWLEYEHRLRTQHRNCLLDGQSGSSGQMLYRQALAGGSQALGQPVGKLSVGLRADWLVLDENNPFVAASAAESLFDRWLFGNTASLVRDVMVAGQWVIRDGHHAAETDAAHSFMQVLHDLF